MGRYTLLFGALAVLGCASRARNQARDALKGDTALSAEADSPAAETLCGFGADGARIAETIAAELRPGEAVGRLRLSISDVLLCVHQQETTAPVPEDLLLALLLEEPDPAVQAAVLASWARVPASADLALSVSLRKLSLQAPPEILHASWPLGLGPLWTVRTPERPQAAEAERAAWCERIIPELAPRGEAVLPVESDTLKWHFEANKNFDITIMTQCETLSMETWREGWAQTQLHHDIYDLLREEGLRSGLDPHTAKARAELVVELDDIHLHAEAVAPLGDSQDVARRTLQINRHQYYMWQIAGLSSHTDPDYSAALVKAALETRPPCSAIHELGRYIELTRDDAGWLQLPWLKEAIWSFAETCPRAVSEMGRRGLDPAYAVDGGALHAWLGPEQAAALRDQIHLPPRR